MNEEGYVRVRIENYITHEFDPYKPNNKGRRIEDICVVVEKFIGGKWTWYGNYNINSERMKKGRVIAHELHDPDFKLKEMFNKIWLKKLIKQIKEIINSTDDDTHKVICIDKILKDYDIDKSNKPTS